MFDTININHTSIVGKESNSIQTMRIGSLQSQVSGSLEMVHQKQELSEEPFKKREHTANPS